MEAQSEIIKILKDNSIPEEGSEETKPLQWIKDIICDSAFFKPKAFPFVIVEDDSPAFESFSPADQKSTIYDKQFLNIAVVIKTKNKNEKEFSLDDYMAFKTDLKSKANQVQELLKIELGKLENIRGGTFGAASIDSIKIDSVQAMICTIPITVIVLK
jgi:hypothetical protein